MKNMPDILIPILCGIVFFFIMIDIFSRDESLVLFASPKMKIIDNEFQQAKANHKALIHSQKEFERLKRFHGVSCIIYDGEGNKFIIRNAKQIRIER